MRKTSYKKSETRKRLNERRHRLIHRGHKGIWRARAPMYAQTLFLGILTERPQTGVFLGDLVEVDTASCRPSIPFILIINNDQFKSS